VLPILLSGSKLDSSSLDVGSKVGMQFSLDFDSFFVGLIGISIGGPLKFLFEILYF
jgi:hypothetical protein